nr:MAG TPA: hypothetical protein [Caudoviricetes sp.]
MTFLGYYLHWSHDELMTLEHRERRRWCTEVSQINKKLSGQPSLEPRRADDPGTPRAPQMVHGGVSDKQEAQRAEGKEEPV